MTHYYAPISIDKNLERLRQAGTTARGARERRYLDLQDTAQGWRIGVLVSLGTARTKPHRGVFWRVRLGEESSHSLSNNWEYAELDLSRPDLRDIRDLEIILGYMLMSELPWVPAQTEKGLELASRKERWTKRFALLQQKRLQVIQSHNPRWNSNHNV